MKKAPSRLAKYEDVAAEYYDEARHPTCASLRELSTRYLEPRIHEQFGPARSLVEVGAGRSMLAPAWKALGGDLGMIELIDSSPTMLSYSEDWRREGVRLRLADVIATGLEAETVDVVIASLGDPYNTEDFWSEVARMLRPGGVCHFTTPAREWALAFREEDTRSVAEFVRKDGTTLLMPSPVPTEAQQADMFQRAGLVVTDVQALSLRDIAAPPAPKLLCVGQDTPVVRGYSLRRA